MYLPESQVRTLESEPTYMSLNYIKLDAVRVTSPYSREQHDVGHEENRRGEGSGGKDIPCVFDSDDHCNSRQCQVEWFRLIQKTHLA